MASIATCVCGAKFKASLDLAGKQVLCPTCGASLAIPPPQPAEPMVVTCRCSAQFKAAPHLNGKRVPCPRCGEPIDIVPQPAAESLLDDPLPSDTTPAWNHLPRNEPDLFQKLGKQRLVTIGVGSVVAIVLLILMMELMRWESSDTAENPSSNPTESTSSGHQGRSYDLSQLPDSPSKLDASYVIPPRAVDATREWVAATHSVRASANQIASIDSGILNMGRARDLLERNAYALKLLHAAAETRGFARYPVNLSRSIEADYSHLEEIRSAGRLLRIEAVFQAREGNAGAAVKSLTAMIRLDRSLEYEPTAVSQSVRDGLSWKTTLALESILKYCEPNEAELQTLMQAFGEIEYHESLRRALVGEYAMANYGFDHPEIYEITNNQKWRQALEYSDRSVDRRFYRDLMGRSLSSFDRPWPAPFSEALRIRGEIKATLRKPKDALNYMLTLLIFPNTDVLTEARGRAITRQGCAQLLIAAKLYQLKHQAPPASAAALIPEFLAKVPDDPFADGPLQLEVTSDGKVVAKSSGSGRGLPDTAFEMSARLR